MFKTIDGQEHGIFYISSIKKDPSTNTLIFYLMNGGNIKEVFGSADEMDDVYQEYMDNGLFVEIEDRVYNVIHFSTVGKAELGKDYLVNITIRTGETLIGKFDNDADRDELYDLIISTAFGGGGGSTSTPGGKLIQKPTFDDFPATGDTKCAYVAKDTDKLYYWDATDKEYVNISGSGGDAVLTEKITSNVTCGAAAVNSTFPKDMTFTDFAKKILTKDVAPSITSAVFKETNSTGTDVGLKEKGTSVAKTYMKATISAGTMDRSKLKEINFYVGTTKVSTQSITNSNDYTFTYNTAINTDVTLKAELVYDGTKVSSKTASYKFIYGKFYGVIKYDLSTSITSTIADSIIAGLSKTKLEDKRNFTWSGVNLNDEQFCYAYPASYGILGSIKDGNGFEQKDGYTPTTITIKYPTNNDSVSYIIWILDDPATGTGFTQIYS